MMKKDVQQHQRQLAAIFFADIVGYTTMMQTGEAAAIRTLTRFQEVIQQNALMYDGEIIKSYGDSSLILFSSTVNAVQYAIEVQNHFQNDPAVPVRIGIHVGEIVRKGNDVFGNGVNIASRLESMGIPGSILISKETQRKVRNQEDIKTRSLGTFDFKNIAESIEVFALTNKGIAIPNRTAMEGKFQTERQGKSTGLKNILILEDEKLAAEKLIGIVKDYYGGRINLTWLQSVNEGINFLHTNDVDLILSDIELLDGKAFNIYEKIDVTAPIIFTTAYDQYLLEAFQTNGIAYLLKPFDVNKFIQSLDKYERMFESNKDQGLKPEVIEDLKNALDKSNNGYKKRFTIKKASGIFLLNISDISHFLADDNIVFAVDKNQKKHIVNHRMSELEELLDPALFFRINRGEMINIDYIEKMENYFNNRLAIKIPGNTQKMITSGSKTAAFRKWIEGGS